MKVYITKYVLTSGIEEINLSHMASSGIDGVFLSFARTVGSCPEVYSKKDWYYDKDSAVARAEEMRKKKIASLRKKIEKLEKMKFE